MNTHHGDLWGLNGRCPKWPLKKKKPQTMGHGPQWPLKKKKTQTMGHGPQAVVG